MRFSRRLFPPSGSGRLRPALLVPLAAVLVLTACSTRRDEGPDTERARAILEQAEPAPAVTPQPAAPAVPGVAAPQLPMVPGEHVLRAGKSLPHFTPVSWQQVPQWSSRNYPALWQAFLRNCQAILERGLSLPGNGSPVVAARPWWRVCRAAFDPAQAPDPKQPHTIRAFLQQHLQPWRVMNGSAPAVNLITGYYEPLVRASRRRHGAYQWPLYAVPDDMLIIDLGAVYPELAGKRIRGKLDGRRVVPYDTRAELERSPEKLKAIVWVDDPIDAFFLQVQGSGRAVLQDGPDKGRIIRLAYADQNGHPYASIGRWLIDRGELTMAEASMQGIKEWARRNPHRVRELLNVNPSVVFFREEPVEAAGEGPRGAFAVPLTAEHSIAVDPAFVPLGSPVLLATTYPASNEPLQRVVFAQDTGTAIKGAGRADFYWGFGDEAGALAGRMKQQGQMWVLWPRGAGAPAADVGRPAP